MADSRLVPRADRLAHLTTLRRAFAGGGAGAATVAQACSAHQAQAAERELLERVDEIVARVAALPDADRAAVARVLATVTEGMCVDLEWFPGKDAAGVAALGTLEDLDRYTYLVAGCVGEFWTELHVAHRPRLAAWGGAARLADGVRFGKALQMTNVLRDVPRDLQQGRCYLPERALAALGLAPRDLLDGAGAARARPLIDRLVTLTLDHYDAAWRYALAVPRLEWRMRLACAWPLLIGLATLGALAAHPNPVAARPPVKIARSRVRNLLARSVVAVWSNPALAAEAARLRPRVQPPGRS